MTAVLSCMLCIVPCCERLSWQALFTQAGILGPKAEILEHQSITWQEKVS